MWTTRDSHVSVDVSFRSRAVTGRQFFWVIFLGFRDLLSLSLLLCALFLPRCVVLFAAACGICANLPAFFLCNFFWFGFRLQTHHSYLTSEKLLKKLPFFSGGAAALQFRTSLVSQPIVAGSQSRVLACEYLCYVILVFVTFLDVLSLQIISPANLSYASFPCLLSCFSSVFFPRRISLPPVGYVSVFFFAL